MSSCHTPLPPWLKARLPSGGVYTQVRDAMRSAGLHSVCEEARCPNLGECWCSGTATFMVLGGTCTRACRFCSVRCERSPAAPDPEEPGRLAAAVGKLKLRHAVLTTVCRDDLPDQGAGHVAACIRAVRGSCPKTRVEALVQDFRGESACIEAVLAAGPHVAAHNIETVERLTPVARDPRAGYRRSLAVLREFKRLRPEAVTKSSLMLGLGEREEEVLAAMRDLREAGVESITLGQYLRPTRSPRHLPVAEFITPERFERYAGLARRAGFRSVASGPLVRSSYRAAEAARCCFPSGKALEACIAEEKHAQG
ncbi:MAG: lipoyl synthase [Elusimicrobiota bacterium]